MPVAPFKVSAAWATQHCECDRNLRSRSHRVFQPLPSIHDLQHGQLCRVRWRWQGWAVKFGIVGGGIGGLTAAVALRGSGHDVVVFERSRERKSQGIALLLWANAMRALDQLDVPLAELVAPIDRTQILSANGTVLCELPVSE